MRALLDQTVLDIVKIDTAAIGGEAAAGIVTERHAPRRGVLVRSVGGIVAVKSSALSLQFQPTETVVNQL